MKLSAKEFFVKRLDLVMTSECNSVNIQNRANILSDVCSVTSQAARKWLTGEAMPDYDKMKLIAARFDVSTSYLIGEANIKSLSCNEDPILLKNSFRNGVIPIELTEDVIVGQLVKGDTAICHPCNIESLNNSIYLLQSSNKRYFRRLSYDSDKNLIIRYQVDGEEVEDIYKDKNLIDLFLSSLVGRVESFIRRI